MPLLILLAPRAWHEYGTPPGIAEVLTAAIWSVIVDNSDVSPVVR